jgi:predicted GNAT superfamily acetyltransferase
MTISEIPLGLDSSDQLFFRAEPQKIRTSVEIAKQTFSLAKFGFQQTDNGWEGNLPKAGETVLSPLTWADVEDEGISDLICHIQQDVFGIKNPQHIIAPGLAGSGSFLVAYQRDQGLTMNGWLGLTIGFGGQKADGTFSSKILAVNDLYRGTSDIGTYLKIFQAQEALNRGFTAINWKVDPLIGINANLNISKLRGQGVKYSLERPGLRAYGGEKPITDKLTIVLDLLSPDTQAGITGTNQKTTIEDINSYERVDADNVIATVMDKSPQKICYEIPADKSLLPTFTLLNERERLRRVFSTLLDTEYIQKGTRRIITGLGSYRITDFVSHGKDHDRRNFYVFTKK